MEAYGGQGVNVSIRLLWCHPRVQKSQRSNFSHNDDVNTTFLAKICTEASQTGAVFDQLKRRPAARVYMLVSRESF